MDAEFIEQQEDFKRLVYFCGFYEVSFPGNGAQYPDLLQVFISFFTVSLDISNSKLNSLMEGSRSSLLIFFSLTALITALAIGRYLGVAE